MAKLYCRVRASAALERWLASVTPTGRLRCGNSSTPPVAPLPALFSASQAATRVMLSSSLPSSPLPNSSSRPLDVTPAFPSPSPSSALSTNSPFAVFRAAHSSNAGTRLASADGGDAVTAHNNRDPVASVGEPLEQEAGEVMHEQQESEIDGGDEDEPVIRKGTMAREHGGPQGAEPTRYGDWERGGRCSDF